MNGVSSVFSEKEEHSVSTPPSPTISNPSETRTNVLSPHDEHMDVPIVPVVTEIVAVQIDTVETVTVLAPTDLLAGYRLHVDDVESGQALCVEVPCGGVRAGEQFQAVVVNQDEGRNSFSLPPAGHVPIGDWRDGIFDCCKFGIFHPLFCLGLWAPPLVIGQQMTRLDLNACAEDRLPEKKPKCSAFRVIFILFALSMLTSIVVGEFVGENVVNEEEHEDIGTEQHGKVQGTDDDLVLALRLARVAVSFFFYVFVFTVALRTRAHVRKKYKIPTRHCGQCEDLCCTIFCYHCMACQIARHTSDYERYPAKCCSETGLAADAPAPI